MLSYEKAIMGTYARDRPGLHIMDESIIFHMLMTGFAHQKGVRKRGQISDCAMILVCWGTVPYQAIIGRHWLSTCAVTTLQHHYLAGSLSDRV